MMPVRPVPPVKGSRSPWERRLDPADWCALALIMLLVTTVAAMALML